MLSFSLSDWSNLGQAIGGFATLFGLTSLAIVYYQAKMGAAQAVLARNDTVFENNRIMKANYKNTIVNELNRNFIEMVPLITTAQAELNSLNHEDPNQLEFSGLKLVRINSLLTSIFVNGLRSCQDLNLASTERLQILSACLMFTRISSETAQLLEQKVIAALDREIGRIEALLANINDKIERGHTVGEEDRNKLRAVSESTNKFRGRINHEMKFLNNELNEFNAVIAVLKPDTRVQA